MHELAITQSVVDTVVERIPNTRITRVLLEIGRLSGVVPDSVRFCFDLVIEGTTLEGCRLEITEPSGLARCRSCGSEFGVDELITLCACGSVDVEVLAGQELRITAVEVA